MKQSEYNKLPLDVQLKHSQAVIRLLLFILLIETLYIML